LQDFEQHSLEDVHALPLGQQQAPLVQGTFAGQCDESVQAPPRGAMHLVPVQVLQVSQQSYEE
jgi:hypothetical protein